MHVFQPVYIGDPQLYKALTEPKLFVYLMNTFITFPFLKSQFWHLFYDHSSIQSLAAHWAQALGAVAENA